MNRRKLTGWLLVGATALAGCRAPPTVVPGAPAAAWSGRQAEVLRGLGFELQPSGEWMMSLSTNLLFDFDSDQLRALQQAELHRVGLALAEVGVPSVRVEGHSDGIGDAAYNRKLSQRRAQSVARVLERAGLRDRLRTEGLGNSRPIADNATEAGRAQNRRVVLIAASL